MIVPFVMVTNETVLMFVACTAIVNDRQALVRRALAATDEALTGRTASNGRTRRSVTFWRSATTTLPA